MISQQGLPKGITTNKQSGKYAAQYWDTSTKCNKFIGLFDTVDAAIAARSSFIDNLMAYNGKVLRKVKTLPNGIKAVFRKNKGMMYYPSVQFWYGKNKDKHMCIHIGSTDNLEEAIQMRLQFIENLK